MSRMVRKGAFREKIKEGKKQPSSYHLSKDKELNMKHVLAGRIIHQALCLEPTDLLGANKNVLTFLETRSKNNV